MLRITKPLLSALTLALLMFPIVPESLAQETRLHAAVREGPDKVRELLPDWRINSRTWEGDTPLHWAVRYDVELRQRDRVEVVRLLMGSGGVPTIRNNKGDTALHLASERGYYFKGPHVILQELLRYGADANVADSDGETPLHRAMDFSKYRPLEDRVAVIRALISGGGDPLFPNPDGVTPLHMAARKGLIFTAPMLESSLRLKLNAADSEGLTPLHYAMERGGRPPNSGSPEEIAELLVNRGANPHVSGNDAPTPWERAWESGDAEFTRLFINVPRPDYDKSAPLIGALRGVPVKEGPDMDYIGRLLAAGADPNAGDLNGETALHIIAKRYSAAVAEVLTDAGADANLPDKNGNTPLHRAVLSEREERYENGRAAVGRRDMVELLLNNGADLRLKNRRGQSPLFIAGDLFKQFSAEDPRPVESCRDNAVPIRCRYLGLLNLLCEAANGSGEECR